MKSLNEMDLEEWELLPDEGFLDGGKKIYSRKYPKDSSSVFQMNYFICPPKSVEKTGHHHHHHPSNHLLPVPIDLQSVNLPAASGKIKSFQDPVSQVFFKKMKESQFVDMKVDSPKSSSSKGIMHQLDFQFDGKKGDAITCKEANVVDHSEKSEKMELDHHEDEEGIWKWSLTGIGAICSFAATFCIISFISQRKNKIPQQNQKLYTNDKQQTTTNDCN